MGGVSVSNIDFMIAINVNGAVMLVLFADQLVRRN